jgi:uncharacterized protein (TIGR02421 family)
MALVTYKEKIRKLSQRLVEAQKPIRILDAVKWDPRIEAELRKGKYKQLPKLGKDYYKKENLGFDTDSKMAELVELMNDIRLTLGEDDEIGKLLIKVTEQYVDVIHLLLNRGTKEFWTYSKKLYGSPKDRFYDEANSIRELGELMYKILSGLGDSANGQEYPQTLEAQEAVDILNKRFSRYFNDESIQAKLSDGIVADAAAGGDIVKIREGSKFSGRDVDILEVHEGWVHVGTTQNGNLQKVAKWLSKGPPRCSATQEGLAVIMEIFTFRSYPKRARHINDRVLAIDKAEDGANVLDIIEFFRTEGYSEEDSVSSAKRVFRGGMVEGGAPFTKDISYCRGFIENYNFMRAAVRGGRPELIPFLFVGKIHVDDIPLLYRKYKEGIIDPPRYLPPQFEDLNGIAVWMSFSSFLNLVDLKRIQEHYNKLFRAHS